MSEQINGFECACGLSVSWEGPATEERLATLRGKDGELRCPMCLVKEINASLAEGGFGDSPPNPDR